MSDVKQAREEAVSLSVEIYDDCFADSRAQRLAEMRRELRRIAVEAREMAESLHGDSTAHDDGHALTVGELALGLGKSKPATYRLLERNAVPGTFKVDPTAAKSRWYIPPDAAARFRARGEREVA